MPHLGHLQGDLPEGGGRDLRPRRHQVTEAQLPGWEEREGPPVTHQNIVHHFFHLFILFIFSSFILFYCVSYLHSLLFSIIVYLFMLLFFKFCLLYQH